MKIDWNGLMQEREGASTVSISLKRSEGNMTKY